ncbi:hypothetical protein [Insolitispirillum peregrinum]|uniref:hypothetical protein n=1 Tax=Insolitispirillum peregrinum TaxID=80876 RepID=UPI00361D6795
MNITAFCDKYAADRRPIGEVVARWKQQELARDLDMLAFAGVISADGLLGDGLLDRISDPLSEGMQNLMRRVETVGDARSVLREALEKGDASVQGFVSKIKGQIGEDTFIKASGEHARLASSGSQEAWDVAIDHGDVTQYVQVKLYKDANAVIDKMCEVQGKVAAGTICDGVTPVDHIDFAVPYDIADAVQAKMAALPELADMQVIPIQLTANEAASMVTDGLDALGPHAMGHFFGELLQGTASAAAIHAMISAVMIWRGKAKAEEAAADVLQGVAISAVAYAAGLGVEMALDRSLDLLLTPMSVGTGIIVRLYLKRTLHGRVAAHKRFELNNRIMRERVTSYKSMG